MKIPKLVTAIATPFKANGHVDVDLFTAHARALFADGSDFLAAFGSTGEGPSLTLPEKMGLLEALAAAGVAPERLYVGAGSCALPEAASLARFAAGIGAAGVLLPPPYYFKDASPDGVFAFYAKVIEMVSHPRLKVILYNYPQMTGIDVTLDLAARIADAFPGTVVGYKDSSGKLVETIRIAQALPALAVYTSSEANVVDHVRAGGAGCFSGSTNITAASVRALLDAYAEDGPRFDALLGHVKQLRSAIQGARLVPAVKALLADRYQAPQWRNMRPPLCALNGPDAADLCGAIRALKARAPQANHAG